MGDQVSLSKSIINSAQDSQPSHTVVQKQGFVHPCWLSAIHGRKDKRFFSIVDFS